MELLSDALAHHAHLARFSVVQYAVVEYQRHVVQKILQLRVLVAIELLFHSSEVHRLLDYIFVVGNIEFDRVYRLVEDPCVLVLP